MQWANNDARLRVAKSVLISDCSSSLHTLKAINSCRVSHDNSMETLETIGTMESMHSKTYIHCTQPAPWPVGRSPIKRCAHKRFIDPDHLDLDDSQLTTDFIIVYHREKPETSDEAAVHYWKDTSSCVNNYILNNLSNVFAKFCQNFSRPDSWVIFFD